MAAYHLGTQGIFSPLSPRAIAGWSDFTRNRPRRDAAHRGKSHQR